MTRKLLAFGIVFALAACGGADEAEMDELDADIEMQQPAPAPMGADTMMMDTTMMDTMGMDSMRHDTMPM